MANSPATTLVAALLYRETMVDAFRQIVVEFDESFRKHPGQSYSFRRPYDDFVTYETDEARITVAHGDALGAGDGSVLALSVTIADDITGVSPRGSIQERLLRAIVQRIQRVYAADTVMWREHDSELDPDSFDELTAQVCAMNATEVPAEPPRAPVAETRQPAEAAPEPPPCAAEPARKPAAKGATPRRMRFAPVEQVARGLSEPPAEWEDAATPVAVPGAVANALPDLPQPMLQEAARIRKALYPEPEVLDPPSVPNLPQRLTTYTLNTALIIVVMPVGVAMLTYNVLGRESLGITARAMALTSIGYVATHVGGLGALLAGVA